MEFDFAIPKARFGADGRKVRPCRRKTKLGEKNRRVIHETDFKGSEYAYHATKGWRRNRPAQIANTTAGQLYRSFLQ